MEFRFDDNGEKPGDQKGMGEFGSSGKKSDTGLCGNFRFDQYLATIVIPLDRQLHIPWGEVIEVFNRHLNLEKIYFLQIILQNFIPFDWCV